MRFLTRINNYICTIYIFIVLYLLALIPAQFELLDPVGKALSDFELTDMVFSKLKDPGQPDTNIVLVNISHLDREGIAHQINILNKYEPAVIGIDVFFYKQKNFDKDLALTMALAKTKNLVMTSDLISPNEEKTCFGDIITSHVQFNQFATNGFADMRTSSEGFRTVREFLPRFCLADTGMANSFAAQIVEFYHPEAYNNLLSRSNSIETINWLGNHSKFFRLEAQDVLQQKTDLSFVKGKIILMGFLGDNEIGEPSLEDTFFTPLNENPAGRTYPDMYGVTIHANIISMILNQQYIATVASWVNMVIAFILVFLNVSLFMWVGENYKTYYDLITKVLILIEVALIFAFNIVCLLKFDLKADFTLAIISVIFSGDLTELYVGSLRDIGLKLLRWLSTKFPHLQKIIKT